MVKSFRGFLMEDKSDKNVHLTHLEDLVLNNGLKGAYDAIQFLISLKDMFSGSVKNPVNVTVKWDGAPAIITGINPDNGKFFVGTKGVFAKNAKLNYTEKDIENNHESEGLQEKLKVALRYLPKLGIKGILQGDLLFTSGGTAVKEIQGEKYVTFTPNTITYAIPINTPLADRIKQAKLGIVFHTEYSGPSMSKLKTSFNVDLGCLHHTKEVWFRAASFVDESGTVTFTKDETSHLNEVIQETKKILQSIDPKVLNLITMNETYKSYLNMFNNAMVRAGSSIKNTTSYTNEFVRWLDDRLSTEIREAKKPETQRKRIQEKNVVIGFFRSHNTELKKIFDLQNSIVLAKLLILHKLSQVQSTHTFLLTSDGYKVTRPEGFVAIGKVGDAVKLVDRMEFSKANFNAPKNWTK